MSLALTSTLRPGALAPSAPRTEPAVAATVVETTVVEAVPIVEARPEARSGRWWERRAQIRRLVGGCPDHWWSPTAARTAACTCDRF